MIEKRVVNSVLVAVNKKVIYILHTQHTQHIPHRSTDPQATAATLYHCVWNRVLVTVMRMTIRCVVRQVLSLCGRWDLSVVEHTLTPSIRIYVHTTITAHTLALTAHI